MTAIMSGCKEFARPYMDYVVIYSESWEAHKVHVRKVLQFLRKAGLTANPSKCCWGGVHMEFLGHRVGNGTMMIPDKRAEAILKYSKPTTKRGPSLVLGSSYFLSTICKVVGSRHCNSVPFDIESSTGKDSVDTGHGVCLPQHM